MSEFVKGLTKEQTVRILIFIERSISHFLVDSGSQQKFPGRARNR